ncbi:MAG TPA: hypothetical protein DHU63_04975 [Candidatus Marinimicrobia bacterium]|nr:hypothetical protein [Candidatus Neomarinimicrobiota bacterium]
MSMTPEWSVWGAAFLQSFVTLLVIMDPFGGLPIFLTLTKNFDLPRTRHSANRAIRVSFILLVIVVFVGTGVLDFFGISLFSFQVGGGLILLLLGLLYVLDIQVGSANDYKSDIIIPMATPLIAGPGAITAVILLVSQFGFWIPLAATLVNLFLFWFAMYNAHYITRAIGKQGIEILSRIMGLLLVALAVEMLRGAWLGLK